MRDDVFSWDRKVPPPGVCRDCGKIVHRKHVTCRACSEWQSSDEGRRAAAEEYERRRLVPFASVCQLSKGRFFWVVVNNFSQRSGIESDQWADVLLASGYAATQEEARVAVGASYPLVMPLNNNVAASVHRTMCARERVANAKLNTKAKGSAITEYLYTRYYDDDNKSRWAEHRIVKKTSKRVFILERHAERFFSAEKFAERPEDFRTYSFDRQKLERDGRFWCRGAADSYYTEEGVHRYEAERQAEKEEWQRRYGHVYNGEQSHANYFAVLGLSVGCTKKDVKKAFRLKSRELHPDSGGDHESFIALRAAYENALRLV